MLVKTIFIIYFFSLSNTLYISPTNDTTCIELFFEKPTVTNQKDIYFYDNYNEEIYENSLKAYKINEGLLYSSKFIKRPKDFEEKISSVPFSYPLLLCDVRYSTNILVGENVTTKFRLWTTDNQFKQIS